MFDLYVYWFLVTVISAMFLALPYYLIARGLAKYCANIYHKVRPNTFDATQYQNRVEEYLFFPWTYVMKNFTRATDFKNRGEPIYVLTAVSSAVMLIMFCLWGFESIPGMNRMVLHGGFSSTLIYAVSTLALLFTPVLKYPIIIGTIGMLVNKLAVIIFKKVDIIATKINTLEKM